ncbi:RHS repeat domain-containing protein [Tenacibaculum amylolyticum]|uniref:RHS repeat domain-containing protein n=1 Tax=Tenacibaculum amylolyticum TaxID=104269 RepID=UPI0038B4E976
MQKPTMGITFTGNTHDLIVAKSPIVSMQYYDGLSRPIQHQYYNGVSLSDIIISGIVYNGWGKPMLHTKSALVTANNLLEYDHSFINYNAANNNITGTLADYYNDELKVLPTYGTIDATKTNNAFTRTLYSNDPLQRKISVLEPGIVDNTENKKRTGYQDQIGVALETAIGISSGNHLKFPTMSTESRDRDQATVKDVFGRTVGTKDGDAKTKFVYQYGRNSFSIAETLPLGIATPAAGFVNTSTKHDLLGDQMQTNSIDEGTTYTIKNRKGLPVFISENNFSAGDSNINWRYIAYDAMDRPVEAGTATIPGVFNKEKMYFYANIPYTIWNFETNKLKYWEYDLLDGENNFSLGRVTQEVRVQANGVASESVEYAYKYNKRGQMTEKDIKIGGDVKDQVLQYTYDASGKVKSITYPNNKIVTYAYDINGRLSGVGTPTNPNEYASYIYGVNGKMNFETFDNGKIQIHKSYTLQEHNKQITATTGGGAETLFTESLEYTNTSGNYLDGMLLKRTEQIKGQLANQWSYNYDNRYQLIEAQKRQLNSLQLRRYSYDVNGRILNKTIFPFTNGKPHVDNISYQAGTNKILETPSISSNSIGLYTGIGTSELGNNTTLQYDSFTRKVARIMTNETSGFSKHMAFLYDAGNNRVQKMVYPNANTRKRTMYIWGNGTLPLYEKHETRAINNEGAVLSSSTNNDSNRVFIYGKGYSPIAMLEGNNSYYFIRDYQNSLRVVVNGTSNTIEEHYNYDPYGRITSSMQSANTNPIGTYLYTGQEYDQEVELYNFKARFYDPEKQIFLQPDPKHINYSPYTFANNNPVNFVDLSGKAPLYVLDAREYGSHFYTISNSGGIPVSFSNLKNGQHLPNLNLEGFDGTVNLVGHGFKGESESIFIKTANRQGVESISNQVLSKDLGSYLKTSDLKEVNLNLIQCHGAYCEEGSTSFLDRFGKGLANDSNKTVNAVGFNTELMAFGYDEDGLANAGEVLMSSANFESDEVSYFSHNIDPNVVEGGNIFTNSLSQPLNRTTTIEENTGSIIRGLGPHGVSKTFHPEVPLVE